MGNSPSIKVNKNSKRLSLKVPSNNNNKNNNNTCISPRSPRDRLLTFQKTNSKGRNIMIKKYNSTLICCDYYVDGFTICISKDKNVYAFGKGKYGIHGHENSIIFPPKQIDGLSNIKMIDCGDYHTICLDFNGNVYSFGKNNGQLGLDISSNELEYTHTPQRIDLPFIIQISCGTNFAICLTDDKFLYSFGFNEFGQLGLGNNENSILPQQIENINNVDFFQCGTNHVLCKLDNNKYFSWGNNEFGKLGQGSFTDYYNIPTECMNWPSNIVDIKSGNNHSLLISNIGKIFSFGYNYYGQLGLNDKLLEFVNIPTLLNNIPTIQRIECGCNHSLCIDIEDNLWVFGDNSKGQLGFGDTKNRYKPVKHNVSYDIINLSSGGEHTFIKTANNEIYAFGNNNSTQLSIKTISKKQLEPIQVLKDLEDFWNI